MSKLGSLYIRIGEPEGELCGCTCEVGDWAADEIERLTRQLTESQALERQLRGMFLTAVEFGAIPPFSLEELRKQYETHIETADHTALDALLRTERAKERERYAKVADNEHGTAGDAADSIRALGDER